MRHLYFVTATLIVAATFLGCASATRLSIEPSEAIYDYSIDHKLSKDEAFDRVEVWIAENYNDANKVTQLKKKESGSVVLKPIIHYKAGGSLGADQYAKYTLRINVREARVDLHFELGQEVTMGTWAPKNEIPRIRANFQGIAAGIARAVDGTIK
jgi:hypothetical protein